MRCRQPGIFKPRTMRADTDTARSDVCHKPTDYAFSSLHVNLVIIGYLSAGAFCQQFLRYLRVPIEEGFFVF